MPTGRARPAPDLGRPPTTPTPTRPTCAGNFPAGVTGLTAAQPNDQYVAKHFPFPWFESLTGAVQPERLGPRRSTSRPSGGTNCDANHIANLDNPATGLVHDLQKAVTTPAFSWITPDNCSDAHDAVCHGNNLSGAFNANGTPIYNSPIPIRPGVDHAEELHRRPVRLRPVPGVLHPADRAVARVQAGRPDRRHLRRRLPGLHLHGNSFNNANTFPATSADKPNFTSSIASDTAGENLFGRNVHYEPTGPNSTLGTNSKGDQLYPGPGDNAFVDRPPVCTQTSPSLVPADCVPGIVEGGAGSPPKARTDAAATGGAGSSTISDNSIVADDTGRAVTGTNIPANSFVGAVTDTGPQFPTTNTGSATVGSFQLVGQDGTPVDPTGPVTGITLSAEGDPADLAPGQTPDPLFNATLPTNGGGDTGSVLISPFIRPGTVSDVFYNHYSWLRTMEDLFNVRDGHDYTRLPAGTVSGGLDGLGHLGYAAQIGLRPFGPDVFNNPFGFGQASLDSYTTPGSVVPSSPWARISLAVGVPLLALAAAGGYLMYLRRRRAPLRQA